MNDKRITVMMPASVAARAESIAGQVARNSGGKCRPTRHRVLMAAAERGLSLFERLASEGRASELDDGEE